MKQIRTSNEILKSLIGDYYVTKNWAKVERGEDKSTYNVYKVADSTGPKFYFAIEAPLSRKKSVLFNGVAFDNVDALLKAVDEFNESRPFPSYTYDPIAAPWWNEQAKLHWYLTRKLNLEWNIDTNDYYLPNAMGEKLFCFRFMMDFDNQWTKCDKSTKSGVIIRPLTDKDNSYVEIKFKDAEQAVAHVNSLIAGEFGINVDNELNLLERLSGTFDNMGGGKFLNLDSIMSGKRETYREKVVPMLESLLAKLKEE